jgi:4-amino-4-deoxy-L-arabinose transferase-like glycosyltransferase
LFFTGLGLGLLAKGPIIGILTLPPIFLWTLFNKNIKKVFSKLPWVGGILLMLGISIPWYVLAELSTPGFFDYFIIGEHFERYLNSEWKGDKYGFPKQQPLGMAWVFLILFLLPWTVALIRILIKKWKSLRQDPWILFLLLWTLWTPFFFTSSKSLIHPYILPSCIPVALIISHYWQLLKNKKIYFSIAFGLPVLLFLVHLSGLAKPLYSHTTDKFLIGQMEPRIPVFSLDRKTYSSQFYTQGKIKVIEHSKLEEKLLSKNTFYILLNTKQWEIINDRSKLKLQSIDSNKKRGIYLFSPVLKDGD